MCFSAPASFAAGATLLPASVYCLRRAWLADRRYIPLALIPLAFGLQQMTEGVVWLSLGQDDSDLVRQASVLYLFFALVFWPFWIPFSLLWPATQGREKTILLLLLAASLVWVWLFFPLAAESRRWLATEVVVHSIRYRFDDLPAFQLVPRTIWRVGYLVSICLPLAMGRFGTEGPAWVGWLVGGLVGLLFAVSYLLFWYAFTSVWCFFAAVLSLLLCVIFSRLPERAQTDERNSRETRRDQRTPAGSGQSIS
jgi:hypothetical protein